MHPVEKQEQDVEGESQAGKDHAADQEAVAAPSLEYPANQHLEGHLTKSCPCHQHRGRTAPVLQDVLRVGQHAGEGAAEEEAQAGGAREQEDGVVGESEKQQVCHHRADHIDENHGGRPHAGGDGDGDELTQGDEAPEEAGEVASRPVSHRHGLLHGIAVHEGGVRARHPVGHEQDQGSCDVDGEEGVRGASEVPPAAAAEQVLVRWV